MSYRVHGIANMAYRNMPQKYYPPKTVKAAICKGTATKKQVAVAIKQVYPDIEFENEDVSDSYAVGITHLITTHDMPWSKPVIKKRSKNKTTEEPKVPKATKKKTTKKEG